MDQLLTASPGHNTSGPHVPARLQLAVGGDLSPVSRGDDRTLELRSPEGETVLLWTLVRAEGGAGGTVDIHLEVAVSRAGDDPTIVLEIGAGAIYPIEIATLMTGNAGASSHDLASSQTTAAGQGGVVTGIPWTGSPGVPETVAQIMEREARTPPQPLSARREI